MKKRKLVKHGPKTLMISLPAKWVDKLNLKKGDSVSVSQEDNVLMVSREEIPETTEKIKISIKVGGPRIARSLLANAYKLGYDEIRIDYAGKEQLKLIKKQVDRMIGFEMIHVSKGSCTIKSVIKSSIEEYDNISRRIWHNIQAGFKILIEDMKTRKFDSEEVIEEMYDNVLKFTDFCRRLINKHMFLDVKSSCLEYSIRLRQVYMFPLIKEIYLYLKKNKNIGNDLIEYVERVSDYFNITSQAYAKKDPVLGSKIIKGRGKLEDEGHKILKKYGFPVSKCQQMIMHCWGCGGHIIAEHYLAELKR